MKWIEKTEFPLNKHSFVELLNAFLIHCPASIRKNEKQKGGKQLKKKTRVVYYPVSALGKTFYSRGIVGEELTRLLNEIKKPLNKNGAYRKLDANEDVDISVEQIIGGSNLGDPVFDLIVFKKRSDMPDLEAIYYYIRNAFAHGTVNVSKHNVYLFESVKDGTIRARMRLKEETLFRLAKLAGIL